MHTIPFYMLQSLQSKVLANFIYISPTTDYIIDSFSNLPHNMNSVNKQVFKIQNSLVLVAVNSIAMS